LIRPGLWVMLEESNNVQMEKTMTMLATKNLIALALTGSFLLMNYSPAAAVSDKELKSLQTPDTVETSIGTLHFFDGVPTKETTQLAYDNLDRMRGVDAFLKGMPGASLQALIKGAHSIGAVESNQVYLTDKLLDSKPLFLTGNTSTLYIVPDFDLEKEGPTVVEVPPGMLGAFNDAWFRYMEDVGPAGPDKGKGGKYLLVPPGYEGKIPEGYFVVHSKTYRVWAFMRGDISKGLEVAVKNATGNLKIYPLEKKDNPPKMEFISGSDKSFNTVHSNDYTFYEHLSELIQHESDEMLDPETRGLFASIGIAKGKKFEPDERMKKILTDAVAIGNATARAIVWYPRIGGVHFYPEKNSSWTTAFANKDVFFKNEGAMDSDARVIFHYPFTAVTPAMATPRAGSGSDYGITFLDSEKNAFDGSQNYKLRLPPDVPVNNFWAVTIYDTQTRSQLQTSQPFPTVGSQTKGIAQNEDGSFDIYFGPEPPQGFEKNWLETVPGKSWFIILRMYGPLEPWINKSWIPEEVKRIQN